ncbi:MAG: BRCT domain-containing protein [Planctomycetota bacterium]
MKEDNGPLIALIIFVVLAGFFGTFAYQNNTELIGDETRPSKDSDISKKKIEIEEIQALIKTKQHEVIQLTVGIRQQEDLYNYYATLFDDFTSEYNRRMKLLDIAAKYDEQASNLSSSISKLKTETMGKLSAATTLVREEMEQEVQAKNVVRDVAISSRNKIKEEIEVDKKKFLLNKNYTLTELDNSKSILSDLTQREIERANILDEVDGRVVLADPVNHTVILDIGTSIGVKNGYRFECYAMRPGHKRVTKAYLEVRHADVSKSECIVVRRPMVLPKDPLSDYVATEPEQMFSPYQESGRKDAAAQALAQPLSGQPKMIITGMPKTDPIVEGDLAQNPFFAPGKTFIYYIAGAKKIENDRQKSAIRYRWTEIKQVVESYGHKVSPVVDANVNYIIAQKNPETDGSDIEKAEFIKAKDLGIPVIYEWELFRFLDTR